MSKGKDKQTAAQELVDRARALHALSCLMQLVVTARAQTDIVTWQRVGGLEAEDFLHSVEQGRWHPLLRAWERRKAGGGRSGPSLREQHFRRLAVLLSVTLQRSGLGKEKAREKTAKALVGLVKVGSQRVVERWELELQPPLGAEDEAVISKAWQRCGSDSEGLIRHFLGFVLFPYEAVRQIVDPR